MARWKDAYQYSQVSADQITLELDLLSIKTPDKIVEYAVTHPESEMYKCFNWDDTKAAQHYRLWEARMMVNHLVASYRVIVEEEPHTITINIFSSISTDDGRQYVKTEDGIDDEVLRAKIISEVKSSLSSATLKMCAFETFFKVAHVRTVKKVLEEMEV